MLPILAGVIGQATAPGWPGGQPGRCRLPLVVAVLVLGACAAAPGGGTAGDIRRNMTSDDRHIAAMAMQIAMERRADHEASTWTNGLSGNHGAVVPRQSYRSPTGVPCRRFEERMTVSGVTATFERTACRDDAGRWTTVT